MVAYWIFGDTTRIILFFFFFLIPVANDRITSLAKLDGEKKPIQHRTGLGRRGCGTIPGWYTRKVKTDFDRFLLQKRFPSVDGCGSPFSITLCRESQEGGFEIGM